MRNKVINNRGSLKQIVIEKVSVLVNIDFSLSTSKFEGTRRGNKKTYMCDNARRRIKIQIKKKERT